MIPTLIIFSSEDQVRIAQVELTPDEYAYLSMAHGHILGADDVTAEITYAIWAIDTALLPVRQDYPDDMPDYVRGFAGRFVHSIMAQDDVEIRANKLIYTGVV